MSVWTYNDFDKYFEAGEVAFDAFARNQTDLFQTLSLHETVALGSHLKSLGWADGAEFGAIDNKGCFISCWTLQ